MSDLRRPVRIEPQVGELRKSFHTELDHVKSELVRLAASVTEQIPRATQILLDQDLEGAEYIILGDDEIDARTLDVEEECYQILALQAPVAGDLRAIIGALRMSAEIERSADLVVNICKAARRIYGHDLDPRLRGIISKMGEQAQVLFGHAIDAYVEMDAAKAASIDDMDSRSSSCRRSSRVMPAVMSTSRSPCSSPSWPGSTSASVTTPSTSASGSASW
jgi:phosphate transport system protein